jgi:heme a synthase
MAPSQAGTRPLGTWSHRLALATALAAVPLVLFGGSVTTLGAGMAVDGWLVAEGHFLLFFPVDKWFRDVPTFVEHTHRLFGVLVGLFALGCTALAWLEERRGSARSLLPLAALLAVCAQGALGGLRVLADDSALAFVHGALAQGVFALLCVSAAVLSPDWSVAPSPAVAPVRALRRTALGALAIIYAQVVLGAWLRHGMRPVTAADGELRLVLHVLGAVAVIAALAALVRRGAALRSEEPRLPRGLVRALRRTPVLLLVQLVLGGLAWAGHRPGEVGPAEWLLSIAHVLGGALLLANCALVWTWSLAPSSSTSASELFDGTLVQRWREAT